MSCFFCKGEMKNGVTNHVVNLDTCIIIIIIKNMPCNECVQCGETFYGDKVAMTLERIINDVKLIVSDVAIFEYTKLAS